MCDSNIGWLWNGCGSFWLCVSGGAGFGAGGGGLAGVGAGVGVRVGGWVGAPSGRQAVCHMASRLDVFLVVVGPVVLGSILWRVVSIGESYFGCCFWFFGSVFGHFCETIVGIGIIGEVHVDVLICISA